MNPYETCPVYETKHFTLRMVTMEDAQDLLRCYGDRKAVARMNADNCGTDFYFGSLEEMKEYIAFWLREYAQGAYIRFAVVDKETGRAVGTVEIFGGERGVLQIDLCDAYETAETVGELMRLTALRFTADFPAERLIIKADNVPERVPVFAQYGFVPSDVYPGYYERVRSHRFAPEKGTAYCGLACCVCSENEDCPGCRKAGCTGKDDCKAYRCGCEKGTGCWDCPDFPCDAGILRSKRIRAFARFIGQYGEEALIERLQKDAENGLLYHYPGKLVGDYDLPETEEEILAMLSSADQ